MNDMRDFDVATNESDTRRNENYDNENAIEWISGDKTATVTFSGGRFPGKIRRLAKLHPDEVEIIKDYGSGMLAHIPVKYIRINAPRILTPEQKKKLADRARQIREKQS